MLFLLLSMTAMTLAHRHNTDVSMTGEMDAKIEEFPFIVAILFSHRKNNTLIGEGVLIHPQVVMAATHAVYSNDPEHLLVIAKEKNVQNNKDKYHHRHIKEIAIRPNFDSQKREGNIALLRLDDQIRLAQDINILPPKDVFELSDNDINCVAYRWSVRKLVLKKTAINLIPAERCEMLLGDMPDQSFICAVGDEGKDACQGTRGAPLVCPTGDRIQVVAGLATLGDGCGERDRPAFYANVAHFRIWIDNVFCAWGYI